MAKRLVLSIVGHKHDTRTQTATLIPKRLIFGDQGFVKYYVAILIFWKNGWSIPFNTIFYYALQIGMTLDNSKRYIITVYYKTRGPYNPLL